MSQSEQSEQSEPLTPYDVELRPNRTLAGAQKRARRVCLAIEQLGGKVTDTYYLYDDQALLRAHLPSRLLPDLIALADVWTVRHPPRPQLGMVQSREAYEAELAALRAAEEESR